MAKDPKPYPEDNDDDDQETLQDPVEEYYETPEYDDEYGESE